MVWRRIEREEYLRSVYAILYGTRDSRCERPPRNLVRAKGEDMTVNKDAGFHDCFIGSRIISVQRENDRAEIDGMSWHF